MARARTQVFFSDEEKDRISRWQLVDEGLSTAIRRLTLQQLAFLERAPRTARSVHDLTRASQQPRPACLSPHPDGDLAFEPDSQEWAPAKRR